MANSKASLLKRADFVNPMARANGGAQNAIAHTRQWGEGMKFHMCIMGHASCYGRGL